MENNKRYEAGKQAMEELFSQEVRTGMEEIKKVSPDLWEMIVSFGFGDLYSRKTLSFAQREIITLTTLITQGAFDQLRVHLQAALNVGLSKEEIIEIIIHCAGYVGFPKAVHAMGIAGEIFKESEETHNK
ncbi:carboxymuconolactone decarboxylase family protein [Psychrobacillus lasiicapitis]|uniref:Carboxymuconolactone decarboxylase family protein n=1 Tax=Psychrobacillus lasiicapitis TaxID=1636719 RepID=A0A544T321_9BACI|nr:carboxymuconolactone decarboxylase family protein [Psychrobacillus lasiicapitis]TQR11866.1 carboxymuconolactone decarboxylase family protein [Psychrobacillus lasiicapitis]GGA20079.1 carboxymuconolactone decarboxylase [Psychrobacillus lasiicapitis]